MSRPVARMQYCSGGTATPSIISCSDWLDQMWVMSSRRLIARQDSTEANLPAAPRRWSGWRSWYSAKNCAGGIGASSASRVMAVMAARA